MATNIITTANSRQTQLVDNDVGAFLFVAEGAYITETLDGHPAYYANAGGADVTIKGTVISGGGVAGVWLGANDSATLGGDNALTIGATGLVVGQSGVNLYGGDNSLVNDGMIRATGTTYSSDFRSPAAVYLMGDYNKVFNHGTISGLYGIIALAGTGLEVVNTGTITASIYGHAIQQLQQDGISTTITNSGLIDGDVQLGGSGYVKNSGTMHGLATVGSDGGLFLNNSGTIESVVCFGDGDSSIFNSGTILSNVSLSLGDDFVDNSRGYIDVLDLGSGDDTCLGGEGRDRVYGRAGADTVSLAGGDDTFYATDYDGSDGDDELDGGAGVDTYDGSDCLKAFTVDLAGGFTAGSVGNDVLSGFENATGGRGGDTLTGSADANRLEGGAGADVLDGAGGADRLIGGTGADTLTGGAGRDVMTGDGVQRGGGADTFVFAPGDTGVTASTRDLVTDFTDHRTPGGKAVTGADLLDLHLLDADTTHAGNQAFSFNPTEGAAFSGAPGSLVWDQRGGYALVLGDVNGDGVADFAIQLRGTHALTMGDFVL